MASKTTRNRWHKTLETQAYERMEAKTEARDRKLKGFKPATTTEMVETIMQQHHDSTHTRGARLNPGGSR